MEKILEEFTDFVGGVENCPNAIGLVCDHPEIAGRLVDVAAAGGVPAVTGMVTQWLNLGWRTIEDSSLDVPSKLFLMQLLKQHSSREVLAEVADLACQYAGVEGAYRTSFEGARTIRNGTPVPADDDHDDLYSAMS